ncbi:hypothetical protein [Curtobacterium flaccumfaciens]|uniref:hypothetical protein n=1 Tax=Curtobacterium flaccumfaciens TaxID=2035 RepID=UPI0039A17ED2
MNDLALQVLAGVLSAVITAVPIAWISAVVQRRVERGDGEPRVVRERQITVHVPVLVGPAPPQRTQRARSDSDNGVFVLTGAGVLLAGWLLVQHPVLVTAVLLGAAADVIAAAVFTLMRSATVSGAMPTRAALPLIIVGLGVSAPIAASIAFNTVRFDGVTVWQMGQSMRGVPVAGSGVAGFVQEVIGQYVHLAGLHGMQSIVLIAYAVACTFACLIVTALAAVELLDWNLHIAATSGAAGAFTRRRAARLERQRWWTPIPIALVPVVALTAFIGMPTFLQGVLPLSGF